MRNPVTTIKRKFDGSAKPPWDGDLVDATPDGWLAVFYDHPPHEVGGVEVVHALRYFSSELPLSVLVSFDASGRVMEYQCDAALPVTMNGRRIELVDLDLDVMADATLAYFERDAETFERNRRAMRYPGDVVEAAHRGVALATELLEAKAFPFDGSAEALLGRVLAAQGPL